VYRSGRFAARVVIEIAIASIGAALVACAVAADQQWFDSHFLPPFFVSRHSYILAESSLRVVAGGLGVILALVARRRVARVILIAHSPARVLPAAIAVVLALGTSELILHRVRLRAVGEEPAGMEPRRRPDPRLGWTFVPARTGRHPIGGRSVEYAFDSAGYRVRRADEAVDPERPAIVFTGESMTVGEGLTWEETIPAQTGAIMGIQSANLAVSAFASDQAYMRLQSELPRFRRPVAVVATFAPALFDRNLNDDRPHLGPGLVWQPAEDRWRLAAIAKLLVRYRSTEAIERAIGVTREVLRATVDLAHARGAVPLIIVPQFLPEAPNEGALRRRILDEAGLPYAWVGIDGAWRIPDDGHPDPRAAHAIAAAIAARLRGR
jgi:hypothetical protein